jgi:tetratricopeptide (TPR) repeat protein
MLAVALLLSLAAYSKSFDGEFQFDDSRILESLFGGREAAGELTLADLASETRALERPVSTFSFGLNYMTAGLDVRWYHITNFVVHAINGILVYCLALLTLRSERLNVRCHKRATVTALICSALFLLHPVQVQSVSYIAQRSESMVAMFYLGALVLYIKAVSAEGRRARILLYAATSVSFFLALGCKETAVTAPVVILLYDFYFLKQRPLVKKIAMPTALIAVSAVAGFYIIEDLGRAISAGGNVGGITNWEYLLTQFRAAVLYIRLILLPVNQNLDYELMVSRSLLEPKTAASFLLLLSTVCFAVLVRGKHRVASFSVLWFYIVLAPTSSVIPLVDPVNEHRVYLASAGLFLIISDSLSRAISDANIRYSVTSLAATAMVLAVLGVATYDRTSVWRSVVSLWEDVVRKSPGKVRAHYNLGNAYMEKGLIHNAMKQYQYVLALDPDESIAHNNLANCLAYMGERDKAIEEYKKAIADDPFNYEAYFNLGVNLEIKGKLEEAIKYFGIFTRNAPARFEGQKEIAAGRVEGMRKRQIPGSKP